jgi:SNF2 family DNA or RNA helicase
VIIESYDKNHFVVGCDDRELLGVMQERMDGKKVRMENRIIIPLKSGPKIYRFNEYGIRWGKGAKDVVDRLCDNISHRKETIKKIKSQYGGEIKFDYDCKGKYTPMEHQKVMYNIMAYVDVAAILADPGTCKTASYLWAIDKRIQRGQVKKALIITLSNLKKNVLEEMSIQVPHLTGVILKNSSQSDKILNKTYKVAKKNVDYDIYLSNYESMFSVIELFGEGYFDVVILDEAHRVGSPRSRQTKSVVKKFEAIPYKYIITGTLNANHLLSFFMPFRFLGPDTVPYANYYDFRKKHMYTVDPDGYIWKPIPGSIDVVKNIIGNISVVFKKEECLNLPPIIYEKLYCEMSGEQDKFYKEMCKHLVAQIDDMCSKCNFNKNCNRSCEDTVVSKSSLILAQKLRQVALGFYINTRTIVSDDGKEMNDSNTISFDNNPKIKLLIQTLGNIPPDRQVIIWTNYIYMVELIQKELIKAFGPKSCITCYKKEDAFDQIQRFKNEKIPYLVGNQSKMGVGHNIQFSSYQIFVSNSHSYLQRDQAESRQQRKGQNNRVTVIDLVTKDTVEELIIKALRAKEDLSISLEELARIVKKGVY